MQSSTGLVSKSGLPLIANSANGRCNWWHIDINLSDYTHRSHLVWMLPSNHKINNHLLLTGFSVCGSSLITSSISCIISLWLFTVFLKGQAFQNEIWFYLFYFNRVGWGFSGFFVRIIPVGHNRFSFFLPRVSVLVQTYWKVHIIHQMMDGSAGVVWKESLQNSSSTEFHFNDIVSVPH